MQFATSSKTTLAFLLSCCLSACATSPKELPVYVGVSESSAVAAQPIRVTRQAYDGLTLIEQEKLNSIGKIELLAADQYGIILDAQGVDQSTPGTNAGAVLGGTLGGAAYIDRAIRGGSYSAVNQVLIGVAGAALGSTLDAPARAQFQFRYAVKLGDGEIKYLDEFKSTAFRHSIGVCVLVDGLQLVSQKICHQTTQTLRAAYLK